MRPLRRLPCPSRTHEGHSLTLVLAALAVHTAAWLARTVTAAGGSVDALAKAIGGPVHDAVKAYYETWTARPSFKKLGIA